MASIKIPIRIAAPKTGPGLVDKFKELKKRYQTKAEIKKVDKELEKKRREHEEKKAVIPRAQPDEVLSIAGKKGYLTAKYKELRKSGSPGIVEKVAKSEYAQNVKTNLKKGAYITALELKNEFARVGDYPPKVQTQGTIVERMMYPPDKNYKFQKRTLPKPDVWVRGNLHSDYYEHVGFGIANRYYAMRQIESEYAKKTGTIPSWSPFNISVSMPSFGARPQPARKRGRRPKR